MAALKRLGFTAGKKSKGSHQGYTCSCEGRSHVTVVPMGKPRIPTGTLHNILNLARCVTHEQFVEALR